jgi:hypothetical protein
MPRPSSTRTQAGDSKTSVAARADQAPETPATPTAVDSEVDGAAQETVAPDRSLVCTICGLTSCWQ